MSLTKEIREFVPLAVSLCALALPSAALGQAAVRPTPSSSMPPAALALWNDPAFQRQFTESYAAETEIEPRVPESERKQLQAVLKLFTADKMDEAAALIEKHRSPASSAVFDFMLGNIAFQGEDLDKALKEYRTSVEKFPKFRRAWRNLGVIYVRQADYTNAIEALTKVMELGGSDAIMYGLLGYCYSNVGDNLAAESAYRMAILLDAKTPDWKMGLARSFFKQERFTDAAAYCGQLLEDEPDRIDLWLLQANAFIGLNQVQRAAQNYEVVDRMGGSTPESLSMLGDIYVNDEVYDLAVDCYSRAMDLTPPMPPDRAIRAAKVLVARGALEETRSLMDRIDTRFGAQLGDETRKDLLKIRARIAVAEGAGDEEAGILEQIVSLDPLDGEALILLGQYHARTGDHERAIFLYERAEGLEKFEADAKVRHAQLLVSDGKYTEALPLLRSAQQLKPRENIQQYLDQVERIAKSKAG